MSEENIRLAKAISVFFENQENIVDYTYIFDIIRKLETSISEEKIKCIFLQILQEVLIGFKESFIVHLIQIEEIATAIRNENKYDYYNFSNYENKSFSCVLDKNQKFVTITIDSNPKRNEKIRDQKGSI